MPMLEYYIGACYLFLPLRNLLNLVMIFITVVKVINFHHR